MSADPPSTGAGSGQAPRATIPGLPVVLILLLLSGFAGLVYQVLWMKQLGLLFGNTAQAASVTLAAFFAGLGTGSWWWGRRVGASANPLRLYALLELGIGATALVYYILLKVFYALYPFFYGHLSGGGWMLALKFVLALLLIFPPAFFMGGTIPAMGQAVVRDRGTFGRRATLLYGVNTLGAALGVAGTAFFLVPSLGYGLTYGLAVCLSLAVGVGSWILSLRFAAPPAVAETEPEPEPEPRPSKRSAKRAARRGKPATQVARVDPPFDHPLLKLVCFYSGFAVLALEVLWTRIFAQIHENSVYAFAIILTVVLVSLAVGAWISSALSRLGKSPVAILGGLTILGGVILTLGPWMLMRATHQLEPLYLLESWGSHVRRIFVMGFGGIGVVVVALGTVFPFLMKVAERDAGTPGPVLGRLLAINTLGAILGALACGFILLPWLGMWASMRLLTAGYLIVGVILPMGSGGVGVGMRALGVATLILLFSVLNPAGLPIHGIDPRKETDTVLQTWEGSDCTVSAVKKPNGHLAITINGNYVLGSTGAYLEQANQSVIPLIIFPRTRSICFIGLGTGMSAGAALDPRFPAVKRIVSCELTPEVVEAAKTHIPQVMTKGVFSDPRSTVLVEDGRHFLMATDETFDMINADLFVPYRRGAGSLYSLEHFQTAAKRLNPGGVFVQWLPMYQITGYEFGVIARTMLGAFGEVTMWRNNFVPGKEKIALIGRQHPAPLDPLPAGDREEMTQAVEGLDWDEASPAMALPEPEAVTFFYCGNLTAARGLFDGYPVNTDDKPVIEFETPRTFRRTADKDGVIWCVGPKLVDLVDRVQALCPPEGDPLLARQGDAGPAFARAGTAFHRAMVFKSMGEAGKGREAWEKFKQAWRESAR